MRSLGRLSCREAAQEFIQLIGKDDESVPPFTGGDLPTFNGAAGRGFGAADQVGDFGDRKEFSVDGEISSDASHTTRRPRGSQP